MYLVNAKNTKGSAFSVAVDDAIEALRKSKDLLDSGFTSIIILDERGREASVEHLQALAHGHQ